MTSGTAAWPGHSRFFIWPAHHCAIQVTHLPKPNPSQMAEPGQDQQGAAPASGQPQELTEHEAAIYDRQLRVWGVETQKRQVITWQHVA